MRDFFSRSPADDDDPVDLADVRADDILAWVQEAAGRPAGTRDSPDVIGLGRPDARIIVGEVET